MTEEKAQSGTPETDAFLASSPSAGSNSDGVTLIRSLETRFIEAKRQRDELRAALKDVLRIATAASIGVTGNQPRLENARAALAKCQEGK